MSTNNFVEKEFCKYRFNDLCMLTVSRLYGPWKCDPGSCPLTAHERGQDITIVIAEQKVKLQFT